MRPLWYLIALVSFVMVFLITAGNNNSNRAKGITTKIIDIKPTFLQNHEHSNSFVFNFMNIPHDDVPKYNYLAMKNVSDYAINGRSDAILVLPTLDYQAIYVIVYSGKAYVELKMCRERQTIKGGFVTKGWNLLALDFPKLVKASGCSDFSMEHHRPFLVFEGTARLSVWRTEKFLFFKNSETDL